MRELSPPDDEGNRENERSEDTEQRVGQPGLLVHRQGH